jgi:hypothetical protein
VCIMFRGGSNARLGSDSVPGNDNYLFDKKKGKLFFTVFF